MSYWGYSLSLVFSSATLGMQAYRHSWGWVMADLVIVAYWLIVLRPSVSEEPRR